LPKLIVTADGACKGAANILGVAGKALRAPPLTRVPMPQGESAVWPFPKLVA
jgi:hypothetical protein